MTVQEMQRRLNAQPSQYPPLVVDGSFGPLTRQKLIEFQSKNGLDTTGIADNVTLSALSFAGGGITATYSPPPASNRNPQHTPSGPTNTNMPPLVPGINNTTLVYGGLALVLIVIAMHRR